jgi:rhodanese-related sulfurtransferase
MFLKLAFISLCITIVIACNNSNGNKIQSSDKVNVAEYACLPCGYDCDTTTFNKPGTCSSCKMELVKKENIVHKNITIDSLCFLTDSNTIFLDVRTAEEFKGTAKEKFGAIKNAINIPVQDLEKRRNELEKYKDKNMVVYCSHAHRSAIASYQLTQNGFKHVNNMLGGMSVWNNSSIDSNCNLLLYQQQ